MSGFSVSCVKVYTYLYLILAYSSGFSEAHVKAIHTQKFPNPILRKSIYVDFSNMSDQGHIIIFCNM